MPEDFIIYNPKTKQEVPYKIIDGEIIITSTNPKDNDETCIVTTYENIHLFLVEEKKRKHGKK